MKDDREKEKSGQQLTIVTGFFDFGRGNHKEQARSSQNYLDYFRKWARLQNHVIVYTTKEFAPKVEAIRQEFGRERQTEIHVVDNIRKIEPELLAAMEKVEKRGLFAKWRARDYDVSNLAMYNYVVMLKFWILQDAARLHPELDMFAWLDFGWNHGGKIFPNEEEFDFLWQYPFEQDKVHLFVKEQPDRELGFMKLQTMTDGIMSCQFMCSPRHCKILYEYVKEAMWSLLSIDAMDDDQMLLTMAYKRHPELFKFYESDWFLPVKEYGGSHLTVRQNPPQSWRTTLERIRKRGIGKTVSLFYIQYIKKSTPERCDLEKRIHALLRRYM